jgi:ASC-1-like (ASCH) protein
MTEYKKHLSEPWFSLIKLGIKKCEGRLNKGDISEMKKNDFILFENNDFGFLRTFYCKITSIHDYTSFHDYLEKETLQKCLPGIDNIQDGCSIYYKYYTKEDELKYKIKALRLNVIK